MRTIFALCGFILVAGAVFVWRAMRMPSEYGKFTSASTVQVADLIERPKDFLGKTVAVEGVVHEQCKTMGCYFFIPSGTKSLRVDIQEVAMNAPMREGHQARVEGQLAAFNGGYQLYASAVEFK
jgi:hypothetical protein